MVRIYGWVNHTLLLFLNEILITGTFSLFLCASFRLFIRNIRREKADRFDLASRSCFRSYALETRENRFHSTDLHGSATRPMDLSCMTSFPSLDRRGPVLS